MRTFARLTMFSGNRLRAGSDLAARERVGLEDPHLAAYGIHGADRKVEVAVLQGLVDEGVLEPPQVLECAAREANRELHRLLPVVALRCVLIPASRRPRMPSRTSSAA